MARGIYTWGRTYGPRGFPGPDYTVQDGTGRYTPTPGDASRGGDPDSHAIECAICAYPIADYRALTTCPLCLREDFLPRSNLLYP